MPLGQMLSQRPDLDTSLPCKWGAEASEWNEENSEQKLGSWLLGIQTRKPGSLWQIQVILPVLDFGGFTPPRIVAQILAEWAWKVLCIYQQIFMELRALPLTRCMTVGKLLNSSVLYFGATHDCFGARYFKPSHTVLGKVAMTLLQLAGKVTTVPI